MIKKIIPFAITTMALLLSGCASGGIAQPTNTPAAAASNPALVTEASESPDSIRVESSSSGAPSPDVSKDDSGSKTLVAYFSMPETKNPETMTTNEDNSVVVIDGKVLGNTQYVAQLIQEHTGADIFRIEPKTPYPVDHDTLIELAAEEQANNSRPLLATNVENIDQYDIIFVGYPNWWADMPMILYTFLEENDLSGKTIIPFNTHGGSGFSGTIQTISKLQPNATVDQKGFTVSRSSVADCKEDVALWLNGLNLPN